MLCDICKQASLVFLGKFIWGYTYQCEGCGEFHKSDVSLRGKLEEMCEAPEFVFMYKDSVGYNYKCTICGQRSVSLTLLNINKAK